MSAGGLSSGAGSGGARWSIRSSVRHRKWVFGGLVIWAAVWLLLAVFEHGLPLIAGVAWVFLFGAKLLLAKPTEITQDGIRRPFRGRNGWIGWNHVEEIRFDPLTRLTDLVLTTGRWVTLRDFTEAQAIEAAGLAGKPFERSKPTLAPPPAGH